MVHETSEEHAEPLAYTEHVAYVVSVAQPGRQYDQSTSWIDIAFARDPCQQQRPAAPVFLAAHPREPNEGDIRKVGLSDAFHRIVRNIFHQSFKFKHRNSAVFLPLTFSVAHAARGRL